MKDIRIGTIGSGEIVEHILSAVEQTKGIVCKAVYSRTTDKGEALAQKFNVEKVYTCLEELFSDDEIDYIYIASPNNLHFEHARAALLAGKNVLCEKPFTSTVKEAEELINLAKERELFIYEAIVTMYLPNFTILKEQLAKIGRMRLLMCNYSQYSSRYDKLRNGQVTNVFSREFAGGCLQDINFYNVYFTVSLFGMPQKIEYYPNQHENGIDTSGIIILKYADFVASLSGAKDTWGVNFAQLEGEDGYIYIKNGSNGLEQIEVNTKESQNLYNEQTHTDRWLYEISNLVPVLQKQDWEDCYQRLELTLHVVKVIETARKSAEIYFPADF